MKNFLDIHTVNLLDYEDKIITLEGNQIGK